MSRSNFEQPLKQSFDENESFEPLKNAFILLQEDLNKLPSVEKVTLFKSEIIIWVNKAEGTNDHLAAITFARKACNLLQKLSEIHPTKGQVNQIQKKLDTLKVELKEMHDTHSTTFLRVCLGIITALLTVVVAILDIPFLLHHAYEPFECSRPLANFTYKMFHSSVHPAIEIIQDLYNDLEKINNGIERDQNEDDRLILQFK